MSPLSLRCDFRVLKALCSLPLAYAEDPNGTPFTASLTQGDEAREGRHRVRLGILNSVTPVSHSIRSPIPSFKMQKASLIG